MEHIQQREDKKNRALKPQWATDPRKQTQHISEVNWHNPTFCRKFQGDSLNNQVNKDWKMFCKYVNEAKKWRVQREKQ